MKDFRSVLSEWKEKEIPPLIPREIPLPTEPAVIPALVGPRQAGKTFRLYQLAGELRAKFPPQNILYVDFEHEKLRNLDASDLGEMMKVYYQLFSPDENFPIFLLLDEIQNVRDWDRWVRRVYDSGKFKIFLSGSSSKLLSREIATCLRGRSMDYLIFPFSFREFLRARGRKVEDVETLGYLEERGKILGALEEVLDFGLYPKVVLIENTGEKQGVLKSYYYTIFYRDLVERFRIGEVTLLDEFMRYCLVNFSRYVSISKAYNYLRSMGFRCSKVGLLNFLSYVQQVFFLFPSEIFSYSVKERRRYPKKIYAVDVGIINALYPEFKENKGRLMENLVAIELKRRGKELFYWKDRQGREVDFVIREGPKIEQLIQVTFASSLDEVERRELRALLKASDQLRCGELLCITWDYEEELEREGKKIKFSPLWKWLLKCA